MSVCACACLVNAVLIDNLLGFVCTSECECVSLFVCVNACEYTRVSCELVVVGKQSLAQCYDNFEALSVRYQSNPHT